MAVRPSMAALISRIRDLITDNDPNSANHQFTDQQIQDKADERRDDIRYFNLRANGVLQPGGLLKYLDYYAETLGGDWEDDYFIVDNTYTTVTPDNAVEPIVGHWSFTIEPKYPLYITGKQFDIYGTSADLLEMWLATLKKKFGFSSDGQSFSFNDQQANFARLIGLYRSKQKVRSVPLVRSDMWQDF